jgi:hypothetical protein
MSESPIILPFIFRFLEGGYKNKEQIDISKNIEPGYAFQNKIVSVVE